MAQTTKIQWCDSTVNPTMGCDGCELWSRDRRTCYAGLITRRFGATNPGLADDFDVAELAPGRMAQAARWKDLTNKTRKDKPWLNGLPRLIFVSDMADALSDAIGFEYLRAEIIDIVTSDEGQRHLWLWLTKRPARMAEFSQFLRTAGVRWPVNLWAGTSITTQATTSRIRHLLKVGDESTIRFLSVEPQWERIDLAKWLPQLDWVIQGGESGIGARPFDIAWAEGLSRLCRDAGVAYFLKQLGRNVMRDGGRVELEDSQGGDWSEWPRHLRIRQMPIKSMKRRIR